jgi:hypothetical protein
MCAVLLCFLFSEDKVMNKSKKIISCKYTYITVDAGIAFQRSCLVLYILCRNAAFLSLNVMPSNSDPPIH